MTLSDKNYDNIIKNLKSGKIMDMQGISSWSSERQAEGRQRKFYSNLIKGV